MEGYTFPQVKGKLRTIIAQFPIFRQHRLDFPIHIFHKALIE